ncbi:MAG TPA: DUF5683 domain-containing protein, partial [Bacteroidales bacterium]|nr:DUF5683 domain-containing protein [Bacteroidales bacterium]
MKLSSNIALILLFTTAVTCTGQTTDSIPAVKEKVKRYTIEPIRSTMFAAALPGLGQIYNRKYWKVPFVYAGFGALGYAVTVNTKSYNNFISAYQDFNDIIPETDSYTDLLDRLVGLDPAEYDPVLHPETANPSTTSWVNTTLLNGVDYYRKYRDLSYIGIAAWYLLTIIDAHVDASLFDY